jgi:hypothetical protein
MDGRHIRERLRWPAPIAFGLICAGCFVLNVWLDLGNALVIPGIVAGVLAFFLVLDALKMLEEPILRPRDPAVDQVKRLVKALAESTRVIAEIEREVQARSNLAKRLQADVKRHRELLELNRSEVEAVAQTLRVEVQREGRRGFWASVVVNAIFFGLGIVVTLLLT